MIFEVEDYFISNQQDKGRANYRVTLTVKGENPVLMGDFIVRATSGDKWFVLNVVKQKVFISGLGNNIPIDMIGTWKTREHPKLEEK